MHGHHSEPVGYGAWENKSNTRLALHNYDQIKETYSNKLVSFSMSKRKYDGRYTKNGFRFIQ